MMGLRESSCFSPGIIAIDSFVAFVDAAIAFVAFWQLMRIHSRSPQLGWTRQKVFHLMIGLSNLGYALYLILTLIATCEEWSCWSSSCGFILMAIPKILYFAAFLLLLSYWVDLCHQADDEEDEVESSVSLLEKTFKSSSSNIDVDQRCLPILSFHVGGRQRIVIFVTVIVCVSMIGFAVLIWIGMGKNPIDSAKVARLPHSATIYLSVQNNISLNVYVDFIAVGMLLLGGALASYGLLIYMKMSKVRSEQVSSEIWKVTGLAIVSLVCFTTGALVALLTDIPVLYRWQHEHVNGLTTMLLLIMYYLIGSSTPSVFVLWVMRELPPSMVANRHEERRVVTFISDGSTAMNNRQCWTTVASAQNQNSKASPI